MNTATHPIFLDAPLSREITLSTGTAPIPYHVYDGHGMIVLGSCSAAALADRFAGQDVHPVLSASGEAIVVLFFCDFAKASHGPHLELHMTVLAAPKQGETLSDDPAAWLAAVATRQDWGMLSLHLWNDTPQVVAYNSEYLGLQAAQCQGQIAVAKDQVEFDFSDGEGASLASGRLRRMPRSDARLMWRVMRGLGWRGIWAALRRRPASAHLINRKSAVLNRNGRAQTLTAPDKMVVTPFNPTLDRLAFGGVLARYGIAAKVTQHIWPFRFVYRHPDDV